MNKNDFMEKLLDGVEANYLLNTACLAAYQPGDILIGNIRPYLKKYGWP